MPEVLSACSAAFEGEKDLSFTRLAPEPDALPDISIDYAVMEKASNLSVVSRRRLVRSG